MAKEVKIVLTADSKGVRTGISQAEADLKGFQSRMASITRVGAAVGGTIAAGLFAAVVANTIEAEQNLAQLEARLKSTGGVAGLTADDLTGLADELQAITTYSDDAIIGAENLLLTFTNIRGDVFREATGAILDMSTALGQDLKQSTIQLGKALNDPVKGITALKEVGVSFTKAQKDQVEAMVKVGDVAGAQRLILQELATEFGGAATAARDTFGGAMIGLKNTVGNLLEGDGHGLKDATAAINELSATLNDPSVKNGIASITAVVVGSVNEIGLMIGRLNDYVNTLRGIAGSTNISKVDSEIRQWEELLQSGPLSRGRFLTDKGVFEFWSEEEIKDQIDQLKSLKSAMQEDIDLAGQVKQGIGGGKNDNPTGKPYAIDPPGGSKAKAKLSEFERWAQTLKADAQLTEDLTRKVKFLDDLLMSGAIGPARHAKELEKLGVGAGMAAAEQERLSKMMQEAQSVYDATRTPMENLAADLERIDRLYAEGLIDVDTYARAQFDAWDNISDKASDTTDEMTEFAKQAARNMQDAFADFFFNAMQGHFDNLADDFKATIDRMVANLLASQLMDFLVGDFGKTGNLGGALGSALDGFLSFDGGGYTGEGSRSGGLDGKGGFLAMLHPNETVLDHTRGMIMPASASRGGMGPVNITFHVSSPDGRLDARSQQQVAAMTARAIERASRRNN